MSQNVIRKMNRELFPNNTKTVQDKTKVCSCDCLIKYLEKKILVTGQFVFMIGLSLEISPEKIQNLVTK